MKNTNFSRLHFSTQNEYQSHCVLLVVLNRIPEHVKSTYYTLSQFTTEVRLDGLPEVSTSLSFLFWNDEFLDVRTLHSSNGESCCATLIRLCCFNRAHADFRVWFGRSPKIPCWLLPTFLIFLGNVFLFKTIYLWWNFAVIDHPKKFITYIYQHVRWDNTFYNKRSITWQKCQEQCICTKVSITWHKYDAFTVYIYVEDLKKHDKSVKNNEK